MANKGKKNEMSKKAEDKLKAKIIEDKTFGLKNKNKSAKVNKYVQQVIKQVNSSGRNEKKDTRSERNTKSQNKEETPIISQPAVIQQKVPFGVDPKSVLCIAFKIGQCNKMEKCKFSHDLNVSRKTEKINKWVDIRDIDKDKIEGSNEDSNSQQTDDIYNEDLNKKLLSRTCKYFLKAVEDNNYGWFWVCPNGGNACNYRHALPPGYVLKSEKGDDKKGDNDEVTITLEEFLDKERHKLIKSTPITEESFKEWKERKKVKFLEETEIRRREKNHDIKTGKVSASGRDLFTSNPEKFINNDDEEATDTYDKYCQEVGISVNAEQNDVESLITETEEMNI